MFPVKGSKNAYIPAPTNPQLTDIEFVRQHGTVIMSDGFTALVEVHKDGVVHFIDVNLGPSGSILSFVPRVVNKYIRVTGKEG